jgi:hypothetical protein
MENFDYILDRIRRAGFEDFPFRRLHLEDLFTRDHFERIISSPEVNIPPAQSDEALIAALHDRNFKAIAFPGTTTDLASYLKWHGDPRSHGVLNEATCEGFGVVMRLSKTEANTILDDVLAFFGSEPFWLTLAEKFGLDPGQVRRDFGLQKYLDGYEISPHPDIRGKALTFMININPAPDADVIDYHTHYMAFRPERAYVVDIWSRDATAERCWVPWDWCETKTRQTTNNSMVIFSPSNNTLHAVKASYDHLPTQRTQLYGNLWYKASRTRSKPDFVRLERMASRGSRGSVPDLSGPFRQAARGWRAAARALGRRA